MSKHRNPLLSFDVHLADAEARVMPDGRLYLYGSLDVKEGEYCSPTYRVASTADMVDWTVHETSFTATAASWATAASAGGHSFVDGISSYDELPAYALASLPPGAMDVPFEEFAAGVRAAREERQPTRPLLYAPDAIERDGRYYLFFCLSDDSEGVAVADSPVGPFAEARQFPISGIDPSVFIDEDGQAYLYWGQFSANAARLNADMTTLETSSIVRGLLTEDEHHFHEGASMRKRDGMYYLVFTDTSRGRPTCLGYATSESPLGPFTYRGVIVDNDGCDPGTWNNHGSIASFEDQWYVFYHRSSRAVSSMRRACAEPLSFDPDGGIPEVPMTSQGPGPSYRPGETIHAREACKLTGTAHIAPWGSTEAVLGFSESDAASFRFLANEIPLTRLVVEFEGSGVFDVQIDGDVIATCSRSAVPFEARVRPGLHEVVLIAREPRDLVLRTLAFAAND